MKNWSLHIAALSLVLTACSGAPETGRRLGSSREGQLQPIPPTVIGKLADYGFDQLVYSKNLGSSLAEYQTGLKEFSIQAGNDITDGKVADWLDNTLTISADAKTLSWSLTGAQLSIVPGSEYDYQIINQGSCSGTTNLNLVESANLQAALDELSICKIRDLKGFLCIGTVTGPGGTVVPDSEFDLRIGNPHQLQAFNSGAKVLDYDFTGAHYACYTHKYICGDRSGFMSLIEQILESRSMANCPVSRYQFFRLDRDELGHMYRYF